MLKYIAILFLAATANTCNGGEEKTKEENTNTMVEKTSSMESEKQLHDIWALTTVQNKSINIDSYASGVPTIEVFVEEMKIGGFSGCNSYFATIDSLENGQIKLGPIGATKKYCPQIDEKGFFENLNKVNAYKIEKMQLFLYKNDSLLLSFKKVD